MAKPADPVLTMLANVDIFQGLSKKELTAIRNASHEESAAPGQKIVGEGEKDRRFYLILDGEAEISIGGHFIRRVSTGDSFGEISVIDGGDRTATVTASAPTKLLTLAPFNMKAIIKEHPDVAYKMLIGMCGVLRRAAGRANAH